jgi:hypothetical protein
VHPSVNLRLLPELEQRNAVPRRRGLEQASERARGHECADLPAVAGVVDEMDLDVERDRDARVSEDAAHLRDVESELEAGAARGFQRCSFARGTQASRRTSSGASAERTIDLTPVTEVDPKLTMPKTSRPGGGSGEEDRRFAGTSMELAGLEPATSWVRSALWADSLLKGVSVQWVWGT